MIKNVIIYTRVSTEEQADKGFSLAAQKDALLKKCKQEGWNCIEMFTDDFSAWKDFQRPGYNKLKTYLTQNKGRVQYLLFTQWSRFSRDYTAAAVEIKHLRNLGVEPNAVEQWIDFSVPENLFLLAIYITAPQVENDRLSQRTKSGMRQALKQGRWLWKAPYGYTNNKLTKLIDVCAEQGLLVKYCFELMATGLYKAEEVRRLALVRGLKINKQSFLNMLQNPFYIGKIIIPEFKDEGRELKVGLHSPLIDEPTFTEVQNILRNKKKPYKGNTKDDLLPLTGILYCSKCNKPMTGSASRGSKGGLYHYYHCQRKYGCKCSFKAESANKEFVEHLRQFEPVPEVLALYNEILKDVFVKNEVDREGEKEKLNSQIEAIDKKLQILVFKNLEGLIDDETYEQTKSLLDGQKMEYMVTREGLLNLPSQFSQYLSFGLSFLGNMSKYYDSADATGKKRIIGSIFPGKIYFENNKYRTPEINSVVQLLFNRDKRFKKKTEPKNLVLSCVAPPSGLEPETL